MEFVAQTPTKGQIFRTYFRIVNENDTGKTFSEITSLFPAVSKDAGSFVPTTNAPVQVPTSEAGRHEGWYYLDLTATETDCDVLKLSVHSGGSGGRQVVSQTFFMCSEEGDLVITPVQKFLINVGNYFVSKDKIISVMLTDASKNVYIVSAEGNKMGLPQATQAEYDAVKAYLKNLSL